MNKAILILDEMPSSCIECPLMQDAVESGFYGVCMPTLKDDEYLYNEDRGETRPNWCPLKEMPSKADLDYYKEHFYETPIKDVSVGALKYVRAKARNEVIDEILGETENQDNKYQKQIDEVLGKDIVDKFFKGEE